MKRAENTPACGAFSLVELLVATTVAILLIGLVLTMSTGALSNSQRVTNSAVREGDAQFALEVIIADLEALALPGRNGGESLAARPDPVGAAGAQSCWLTLLTAASDLDTGNYQDAPRAVSYRMAYQNVIDGGSTNPAYALYRAIADAGVTFENANGVSDLKVDFWDVGGSSVPDTTGVPALLVANVVAFDVRFLRADTKEWTNRTDVVRLNSQEATVRATETAPKSVVKGGFLAAEVRITVLSPQGAKLLQSGALPLDQAISRYGSSFSRQTSILPALARATVVP